MVDGGHCTSYSRWLIQRRKWRHHLYSPSHAAHVGPLSVHFWIQCPLCLSLLLEGMCMDCQNLSHFVIHSISLSSLLETNICHWYFDQNNWFHILRVTSVFYAGGDGGWVSKTPCNEKCVCNQMCISQTTTTTKLHLKENEMTHILVSAKNMEIHLFLLTALFKLSARMLCSQDLLSAQHRGHCKGKTHQ